MKHLLIDNTLDGGYDYQSYLEYCEEEDWTPGSEGSMEYWEWVYDMLGEDWNNLLDNIKFSKNNGRCLIFGTLGLWDGRKEIYPNVANSLVDALSIIARSADTLEIYYENGEITFLGHHHDGTNSFTIRPIDEEKAKDMSNDDIEESDEPLDYTKLYKGEYLF